MTIAQESAGAAGRQWLATLVILVSATSFGLIGMFGRLAYDGGSNPLTIALLRAAGLVVCAAALLAVLRRRAVLPPRALRATLWLGACALMSAVGFLGSVAYIPVSLAALVLYTYPLIVGVLATVSGRERVTAAKAALLVGAFAGLALALGPPFSELDPRGLALGAMAAVGNALFMVFGGRAVRGQDALAMNLYTNLWVVLAVGAFLLLAGGFALPATGLGQVGAAGAVLSYVAAFLTWFIALPIAAPVRMAVLYNLDAVVNILAGVLVLGETLSAVQVAGVVLVLGCLVLMALRRGE